MGEQKHPNQDAKEAQNFNGCNCFVKKCDGAKYRENGLHLCNKLNANSAQVFGAEEAGEVEDARICTRNSDEET